MLAESVLDQQHELSHRMAEPGWRVLPKPHLAQGVTLSTVRLETKENPAGLEAGFSAAGSGIQGLSRQLLPSVMIDRKESNSVALRNMFSRQRCSDDWALKSPANMCLRDALKVQKKDHVVDEKTPRLARGLTPEPRG